MNNKEAKKLQRQIAISVLSSGNLPKGVRGGGWSHPCKVWHIESAQEPHCTTCKCYSSQSLKSICGLMTWEGWLVSHPLSQAELKRLRPCKHCLNKLSKIANS